MSLGGRNLIRQLFKVGKLADEGEQDGNVRFRGCDNAQSGGYACGHCEIVADARMTGQGQKPGVPVAAGRASTAG